MSRYVDQTSGSAGNTNGATVATMVQTCQHHAAAVGGDHRMVAVAAYVRAVAEVGGAGDCSAIPR